LDRNLPFAGSQKVIGSSPLSSTPKALYNNELCKASFLEKSSQFHGATRAQRLGGIIVNHFS
jgi:hypothetical protein